MKQDLAAAAPVASASHQAAVNAAMAKELGASTSSGVGAHRVDLESLSSAGVDSRLKLGQQEKDMRHHESLLLDQIDDLNKQLSGKVGKKDKQRIEVFLRNLNNDLNDVRSKGDALRLVLSDDMSAITKFVIL